MRDTSPRYQPVSPAGREKKERHLRSSQYLLFSLVACTVTAMVVHAYDSVVFMKKEGSSHVQKDSMSDPDPSAPWPRVAWLMSFPNSGTTFTLDLVTTMTNRAVATNYGQEPQKANDALLSISHATNSTGPFWLRPDLQTHDDESSVYVLTKTHCGGRCSYCGPETYIETVRSFDYKCRTGSILVEGTKVHVTYDSTLVQRAVHLIRNPFDNLVARLHMEQLGWRNKLQGGGDPVYAEFLSNFTDTREGLHAWCRYMDAIRTKDERRSHFIDDELSRVQQHIPCHAEFYRYVQWHSLALEVTRRKELPTYTLFYENYASRFDETASELLKFLHLQKYQEPPDFVPGKHYEEYFDARERKAVARFVWELASPEIWSLVRHYVEKWLDV